VGQLSNSEKKAMKSPILTLKALLLMVGLFWSSNLGLASAIENKSRVISPYWQSGSGSYTFIAVSHSSLSSIASQIGLVINAIQNDLTAFGTAITFTISAGSTERIFIVRTNNSTINLTNISSARFIVGTTNFKHGHLRIEPMATNPSIAVGTNNGHRDITMLNFWGAVVIETNTTGFAMEFIGDMQDSAATPSMDNSATVSGVN
jgi:hypothetical protein